MWQCGLCSHVYDESKESIPWDQLPDDWQCPICGSPKSSFVPLKAAADGAVTPPCPADAPCARYQCNLCSHVYDEAREDVRWDDLPDDWVCPVCGSGKDSFTLIEAVTQTSETPSLHAKRRSPSCSVSSRTGYCPGIGRPRGIPPGTSSSTSPEALTTRGGGAWPALTQRAVWVVESSST